MLSDKYKQRREESLSKSQERKSYYAQVEDHRDHTYLSAGLERTTETRWKL